MNRRGALASRYGFDALVLLAATGGVLEVALRQDAADAPSTSVWLAAPATALAVLPLLGRRRFPFAAPAALWLLAAALSFLDGRLVAFAASVF
ncbi:MAG TPA: hypothetical protein VHG69_06355, partial [Thermoleophilaceae bacterium]|nr:hypothetical protein [Thermoleophilaceae bacterium]